MRARKRDITTAKHKNIMENTANSHVRCNHPNQCDVARNITSTGMVTSSRVIMTSFWLASSSLDADMCDDGNRAAACSAVDNRETKMEPTLPGRPLMTMASNGNPA